jgi:hypothetical protein
MAEESKPVNDNNIIFERRKFVRIDGTFVISYSDVTGQEPKIDLSQTKNISVGGILFTTGKQYDPGATLKIKLRLPDAPDYLSAKVRVISCKEKLKGILYDTRVKFTGIREEDKDAINKIIEYNAKGKNTG